jgi:hypothetical protein
MGRKMMYPYFKQSLLIALGAFLFVMSPTYAGAAELSCPNGETSAVKLYVRSLKYDPTVGGLLYDFYVHKYYHPSGIEYVTYSGTAKKNPDAGMMPVSKKTLHLFDKTITYSDGNRSERSPTDIKARSKIPISYKRVKNSSDLPSYDGFKCNPSVNSMGEMHMEVCNVLIYGKVATISGETRVGGSNSSTRFLSLSQKCVPAHYFEDL